MPSYPRQPREKKAKGPKWDEVRAGLEAGTVLERPYSVLSRCDRVGRSSISARCPFCETRRVIFIWSLCGGGHRCTCGALFGSGATAYHFKKDPPPVEDTRDADEAFEAAESNLRRMGVPT
jgi:hypothetical protein